MKKTKVMFDTTMQERVTGQKYKAKYVNIPKKGTKDYDKLKKGDNVKVTISKEDKDNEE